MKSQNFTRLYVMTIGILWLGSGATSLAAMPSLAAGLGSLLWTAEVADSETAASDDSVSGAVDEGGRHTKPSSVPRATDLADAATSDDDSRADAAAAVTATDAVDGKRSATGLDPVVGVQPTAPIPDVPTTVDPAAVDDDKSLDPAFPVNNLVATLPAQGSVTIEFEVQVKAYNQWAGFPLSEVCDQHTVTDDSGLSVVTDDPGVGGATDPTCVPLDTADLSVSKSDSVDPVVAGSALAYTVTVSNAGPAAAENVVVTDTLPAGVTFVSTSGCAEDPVGVPTCTLGSIGNGAMASYTVNVTVDSDTTGSISNSVSVASAREAAPGNESASESTTIGVQSDLTITKTDSVDPVNAGANLAYTVTVDNNGPSDAEGVVVTDTLPAGVNFVSTSGCAEDPAGVPTCTLGSLASGDSGMYTINVTVDPLTNGTITNTASVTASTPLINTGDDSTMEETEVNGEATLTLTKSDAPDPVLAGNQLTYTLGYANAGPGAAAGTMVFDLLPDGTTYASDTLGGCTQPGTVLGYGAGLDESAVASGSPGTGAAAFFLDTMTDGLRFVLDVDDMVNAITSATLRKASDDSLVHDLYAGSPTFDNGNPISGFIQLTPLQATELQAESHYVDVRSAAFPAGELRGTLAASATGPVVCDVGSVANGDSGSFDLVVNVASSVVDGSVLTNLAAIDTLINDPNRVTLAPAGEISQSRARTDTDVGVEADLVISKTDDMDPIAAGGVLTYTVAVTNNGPSDALDVVVTDTLPGGVTMVSTSGCAEDPSAIPTCTLGTVAAGATESFDISVTVDAGMTGTLTNTASVVSSTPLVNTGDDSTSETTAIAVESDLTITKTDNVDPVVAGSNLVYTVAVTNNGPSNVGGVMVTDILPAGVTLVSTAGCAEDPAAVPTCTLGSIAAGNTAQYTVTVQVDSDTTGTLTNAVSVTASTPLINTGDDSTSENTVVGTEADLVITKVDDVDPVVAGNNLVYTLEVTNNGPSDALDVVVTDTLPAGVTLISTTGCAEDPNAVPTCTLGTLASGNSVQATVTVSVDSDTTGTLTNTASVTSSTTLINTGDDSVDETTVVESEADLVITKVDDVDPVVAGNNLVYTLEVTNNGPSDALDVEVDDTLPAGVTLVATSGCGEDPTGIPTCSLGTIAVGNSAQYTVEVTVDSGTTGTLSNTATVTSSTTLIVTGDDSVTETTDVESEASLSTTKIDSVDPVAAGAPLTYSLGISNAGPSDASDVTLFDLLPDAATYVSDTGGCVQSASLEGVRAVMDPANELPPVASSAEGLAGFVLDPVNQVLYFALHVESIDNITSADIFEGDAATTGIVPVFRLYDGTPAFGPGQPISGDIALTASEVTALLNDPHYVQVRTSDVPTGEMRGQLVTLVNDVVVCDQGTVAASGNADFDIVTATDAATADGSVLSNISIVTSSTTDPNTVALPSTTAAAGGFPEGAPSVGFLRGATAIEETAVISEADLSITKVDDMDPAGAGSLLTYTVQVTNNGPSDALDVVMTDTLPAEVVLDSTSGCGEDPNGVPTCSIGTLAAGDSVDITVAVTVDPATNGTITNNASVTTSTTDPVAGNNATSEDTDVVPLADLAIVKSDSVDPVGGQSFSYTLEVTNNGPSTATAVEITDVLPAGLVFNSSPDGCTEMGGTVTCVIGAMTSGQMESRTLVVDLMAPFPPVVTNTASVDGAEVDPDTANNSDSEETTLDVIPPTVTNIDSVYDTGDGTLEECETVNLNWLQRLLVTFSESMFDPVGDSDPDDVTNPANYQLVAAGADRSFQTTACGGALGDDVVIGVDAVSYDDGTFTADLTLAMELPDDLYRLEVCGSTTLVDLAGNSLDGDGDGTGGDDFERGFRVDNLNRLANGHFDCDLDSWTTTSTNPAEIVYDSDDFEASDASGSAQVENLTGSQTFALDQCAPIVPSADHRFSLALRLAADPGIGITTSRSCRFFSGDDCAGSDLGPVIGATEVFDTGGAFVDVDLAFTAPDGALSARCGVTMNTGSGDDFVANVDAMTLLTEGAIFGDGFESGDLSAWSAAVP